MSFKSDIYVSPMNAGDFIRNSAGNSPTAIRWLGQAGFQIFHKDCHLMIDPYLSDYLAKKYAGKEFPHTRMTPSPLVVSKINDLDFILCTHRHSDHMDPEAVPLLLENNSKCQIVAPRAEKEHVIKTLGIDEKRVIFINADETIKLNDGITIEATPSAHEELKIDEKGNYHFLGYILRLNDIVIYHSGDCVPYVSLQHKLKNKDVDVALLPVNGRDDFRASKGVPGNFSFEEAVELCKHAEIQVMICHHFGMFSFNTIDQATLVNKANSVINSNFQCIVPKIELTYQFTLKKRQSDE